MLFRQRKQWRRHGRPGVHDGRDVRVIISQDIGAHGVQAGRCENIELFAPPEDRSNTRAAVTIKDTQRAVDCFAAAAANGATGKIQNRTQRLAHDRWRKILPLRVDNKMRQRRSTTRIIALAVRAG